MFININMFKTVDFEIKQQRLNICKTCKSFSKKFETCTECGCYMPAKATFASSECPLKKWTIAPSGKSIINTLEEMILESWNK